MREEDLETQAVVRSSKAETGVSRTNAMVKIAGDSLHVSTTNSNQLMGSDVPGNEGEHLPTRRETGNMPARNPNELGTPAGKSRTGRAKFDDKANLDQIWRQDKTNGKENRKDWKLEGWRKKSERRWSWEKGERST